MEKNNEYDFLSDPDIFVASKKGHCHMCGKLTDYVEINAEAYFCSLECLDKFYKESFGRQESVPYLF